MAGTEPPGPCPRGRVRTALLIVFAASIAAVGGGSWAMARRIAAFNASSGREQFVFQPVKSRSFTYAGREVTLRDEKDAEGRDWVVVRYGDDEARLLATIPPGPEELPGLTRHDDWMQVLRFAPRKGLSMAELQRRIDAGLVADRLVIVTRHPRPGSDARTYGEVSRSDWTFEFREFLPGGGFAVERLRFPETERSLRRRQDKAKKEGRPIPHRREDEVRAGTWQFEAALLVMPTGWLSAPGGGEAPPTFAGDALHALGWTLPATGVAFVVLTASGAALLALRRGRQRA